MRLLTAPNGAPVPPHAPSLEALIARIAYGDAEALSELYRQTSAAIYGYALSIVKNRPDAEDVMQETYMKLLAAAHQYRAMGKPMAWVMTVARNEALMKLRSSGREMSFDPATLDIAEGMGPSIAPEDGLVLKASLQMLSDEERQVVMLHALAGLKHREIAGLMGLPLSTALSKYNRALKKLRRALKEGGYA